MVGIDIEGRSAEQDDMMIVPSDALTIMGVVK